MPIALLVPIYLPTALVLPFLKQFKKEDFTAFLVVDDGSGKQGDEIFDAIPKETVFSVMRIPENHGKGFAMKAGLRYLRKVHPELTGIVTADGDGQHDYSDILKVRDELSSHPDDLVLGSRNRGDMPPKSKKGNWWACVFFKFLTGVPLKDTQTGLRGIPSSLFDEFLAVPGKRYEFEMNFLSSVAGQTPIREVPIQTIYLNDNAGSHYRPFVDTMRVGKSSILAVLLLYFGGLGLDVLLFWLFHAYVWPGEGYWWLLACSAVSSLIVFVYEEITENTVVFLRKPAFRWAFGESLEFVACFLIASCLDYLFFAFTPLDPTLFHFLSGAILLVIIMVLRFGRKSSPFLPKEDGKSLLA